jgi:Tol biopolymer transport system component
MAAVGGAARARESIGEGEQVSSFVLTDAAIERALAPGLDVTAPADFVSQIGTRIAAQPRRSGGWVLNPTWPRTLPAVAQLLLLALLLLALVIGAFAVASQQRRGLANGHAIVATGSELLDIDPETGTSRTVFSASGRIFGVTRSGDGSLISFWTETVGARTLEIVNADGSNRRRVAEDVVPTPIGEGQIDVWSPDRRFLAAGVVADVEKRILLVDTSSGTGKLIGPPGASNPLWSPDGLLLAFSYARDGHSVLAVMRPDGLGLHDVSGDMGGFEVSGANNWSPDGVWVYFGAERNSFTESHIYRADVAGRYSVQLTFDLREAAPALSPDGTMVAYSYWTGGRGTQSLHVMDADGGNDRVVLENAINDGWSNDGQYLLTEWRPAGAPFELLLIRPDGTDHRTLLTMEGGCAGVCWPDLGWGQPRP